MSDDGQQPEKTPIDQALDLFVYAPIGFVFEGASLLPQLVEKGKAQVTMAKAIGRFAVEQGRGEASKTANRLQDQAAGLLDFLGESVTPVGHDEPPAPPPTNKRRTVPRPPRPDSPAVKAVRAATDASTRAGAGAAKAAGATAAKASKTARAAAGAAIDVASLAIPDYDALSASHVVNRLAGLSSAELEAVRLYEAANRGRKTILSKVTQLQG